MTEVNNNIIEPDDPSALNAPVAQETLPPSENIVSVNRTGKSDNKFAKGMFFLVVGSILVGLLAWMSQSWLNTQKAHLRASAAPKSAEDTSQVFNPEKTGSGLPKPKLGADSGQTPPSQVAAASGVQPGQHREDGLRPLRGADGKVMVNPQGQAMAVDKDGNVVTVPAIDAQMEGSAQGGRKPLPGEAGGQAQAQAGGGQNAQAKPASRFGGSLFVGAAPKASPVNASGGNTSSSPTTIEQLQAKQIEQTQQLANSLRGLGLMGGQGASTSTPSSPPTGATPAPYPGAALNTPPDQARPGTIGSTLYSSSTPTAIARQFPDQNLVLPKGRTADCILTGRIMDEVPGFTTCVLATNLYGDNGKVLLLERGSELAGEYGVTNQLGLERLFVTWTRAKTKNGVDIDLSSPGSDRLGTSGLPGHLDNRWGARIGAAFLVSLVKDITVAVINNQQKENNANGTSVNVTTPTGQNTINASAGLAEEIIKQTIRVRPRLTINEGERISITVARDLDFSSVYALQMAGRGGSAKVAAK
ncbi:TrbI/VirB10 family protein [Aquabacterium soli]|uniref:TrbI/VirB10 family protein n=1 Tax=Aquabacterium soli TaxID=2493092 RepID=A0A3R8RYZ0_9BURK|nr:TrbI/VirB10 family protein [Aquabacterium soli]RRS01173.1 TrbI/VirB10 family protein [Aquabacterium soli]